MLTSKNLNYLQKIIERCRVLSPIFVVCTLLYLSGCGNRLSVDPQQLGGAGNFDTPIQMVSTALSTATRGLNSAEGTSILGAESFSAEGMLACSAVNPSCVNDLRTYSFNSCSSQNQLVSGVVNVQYNSPAACAAAAAGNIAVGTSLTQSTSQLALSDSSGITTLTSDARTNYRGTTVGGGESVVVTGAQAYSLSIAGYTRSRTTVSGGSIFEHSVHTLLPLTVTGTAASHNRTIQAGRFIVDSNFSRYSADISVSNLAYTANCCLPVSGTVTATVSGSINNTMTITFGGGNCGAVQVTTTTSSGTANVSTTMNDCG